MVKWFKIYWSLSRTERECLYWK